MHCLLSFSLFRYKDTVKADTITEGLQRFTGILTDQPTTPGLNNPVKFHTPHKHTQKEASMEGLFIFY